VSAFVPTIQREQILAAPSEHRRATRLVKFSHTDALLERDGPTLHDWLQASPNVSPQPSSSACTGCE
jgi:hypothetical protein